MFMSIGADCGRSGPVISLHEACSETFDYATLPRRKKKQPHMAGLKENNYTEIENRISGLMSCSTE